MTIHLKIDGMHCSGCVNAIRRALAAVHSVAAISIDLDAGRATIEASPGVDADRLITAVHDAGYDARVES